MESSSPAYAALPLLCSPVKRSELNVKISFMIDAALFPALETLLAVARTGSVGAAARQRHITSSAVSQQIRKIESHFGIRLFERAGRGVRLTATGEAALPVVRELWIGAESAFGQLAELAGHPATTLRVAASDYLGKGLLAPVLRDLLDAEPPVRFEIVTTHSREGVRLLLSYVSGGLGIGLVPALALAEAPADRVVSAPARVPALPVTLVWRTAARRQPALARLADLLATAGARVGARLTRMGAAPALR